MKKVLKILLYTFLVSAILFIVVFKHTSKPQDYFQSRLYKKTNKQFSEIKIQKDFSNSDTIQAGWHKMSITPTRPAKLAGYGIRGDFTGIKDSLYVRSIVFKNKTQSVAYLSYDLILVSKNLANAVRKKLKNSGITVNNIYFSAIHTHSSFGGWSKAFGMQILYGRYDRKLVDYIASQTVKSIEIALKSAEEIKFGYTEIPLVKTVRNHFGKEFHADTLLRVFKMKNCSGNTAFISSFSAHGTYLHPQYTLLSGDYPGLFNSIIEEKDSAFSVFSAGAVACHRLYLKFPTKDSIYKYRSQKDAKSYANYLVKQLNKNTINIPLEASNILEYQKIEIPVTSPEARIGNKISFRSWVIFLLSGKPHPYISYLRIGNNVFIGNPGDISGELYPEFDIELNKTNTNLILTSFNGEYMGYIIPDHHFDIKESEAREMNWYRAGSHFTFMIKSILNKIQ